MTPLRLALIAILVYILYRLLVAPRRHQAGRAASGPAQDVLIEDPVCHTYVPQRQAVVLRRDGRSYYFCSQKCRDRFLVENTDKE